MFEFTPAVVTHKMPELTDTQFSMVFMAMYDASCQSLRNLEFSAQNCDFSGSKDQAQTTFEYLELLDDLFVNNASKYSLWAQTIVSLQVQFDEISVYTLGLSSFATRTNSLETI